MKRLVLQPRDRLILCQLSERRILDRAQIARLAGFHSISRVNVRLSRLRATGLISRYYTASKTGSRRSVYALTKRGALEAHVPFVPLHWRPDSVLLGNAFVAHQLALNDLYLDAVRNGTSWEQPTVPLSAAVQLIPDARFVSAERSFFIEMDLGTETLSVWTRKVADYVRLASTGLYRSIVAHDSFAVLVVTDSDKRLDSLRRHVAKQTQKLFWFATLDIIQRQGFWSVSWLRATGTDLFPPGA